MDKPPDAVKAAQEQHASACDQSAELAEEAAKQQRVETAWKDWTDDERQIYRTPPGNPTPDEHLAWLGGYAKRIAAFCRAVTLDGYAANLEALEFNSEADRVAHALLVAGLSGKSADVLKIAKQIPAAMRGWCQLFNRDMPAEIFTGKRPPQKPNASIEIPATHIGPRSSKDWASEFDIVRSQFLRWIKGEVATISLRVIPQGRRYWIHRDDVAKYSRK